MADARPSPPLLPTAEPLIGGAWQVDFAAELAGAGGGLPAYAVRDRHGGRTGLMAVLAGATAPPRAQALNQLLPHPIEGMLSPIAQGPALRTDGPGGARGWFVVCAAPPGPALDAAGLAAWPEAELLDRLLRPAARALDLLLARHVTHRAIRPDNLFRAGPRDPVVLGSAWAAPPASLQPALYEPPYVAACLTAGRGEGSIADDVYALGVTMLALALGRVPLAGVAATEVVRRKLELGSYAALVGEARLPPVVADLLRGMLAEDPEHRPPPALLVDPMAARGRRMAARPPRAAQQPLAFGAHPLHGVRSLAHALAADPVGGVRLLRRGVIDRWLRRDLGDAPLAIRLNAVMSEEASDAGPAGGPPNVDAASEALLAMRAVALLDPLAPLCWGGLALWPDGLGPALAEADGAREQALQALSDGEAISAWAELRPDRCDPGTLRLEANRQRGLLRRRGWAGGMARLRYALNPLLACRSPVLGGRPVVRLAELLPALEAVAAADPARLPREAPILDREIAGFIAARHPASIDADLLALAQAPDGMAAALLQLRLLAALQTTQGGAPLPALAGVLARQAAPALACWRNHARRARRQATLEALAPTGQLSAMLAVFDDPDSQRAEARELQAARTRLRAIDRELAGLAGQAPLRRAAAGRVGQELSTAAGAAALALTAVGLWFG